MPENDGLAQQFEEKRRHLRAVAFRMLGSESEADDAVQEAWLNVSRAGAEGIENLGGWLTTVVARVCLDQLRARKARHEDAVISDAAESSAPDDAGDPELQVSMAEAVGPALLMVLERLSPSERVAFVLHDMFAVPFEEIATIVGRSPIATRQLASRGRRLVQGAGPSADADRARQRQIVEAFLQASRQGNLSALLAVLDPEVVARADASALEASRRAAAGPQLLPEVRGAEAVASTFSGRAGAARVALLGGAVGAVWAPGGTPRAAFVFTIVGDKVTAIDVIADQATIAELEVELLSD